MYQTEAFGIETPNVTYANVTNAPSGELGNLGDAARTCATQYGRAPTYLVVDFFNVGPAIAAADALNGVSNPVGRTTVSQSILSSTSSASGLDLPFAIVWVGVLTSVAWVGS